MKEDSTLSSKRGGSAIAFIIALLALSVGGFFVWREFDRRQKIKAARAAEYQRQLEEQRRREAEAAAKTKPKDEKKDDEEKIDLFEAPKLAPKKTPEELWAEELAARKAAQEAVEAARAKATKPLTGLGGIKFGVPIEAAPVRWGTVQRAEDGASVGTNGVTFAVYGPKFKKSFLSFGAQPLVWVTPKTHKAYRIEISRPIKKAPDSPHDAETAKAVEALQKRFECEPIQTIRSLPDRPGCEYVFPLQDATVKVIEAGGLLTLAIESESVRREALAESETARQERLATAGAAARLEKTRYPRGPMGKYPRMHFNEATPKSFCGVTFGTLPPENALLANPQKGEKGFFLDYEKANGRAFDGFDHGKADIDPVRRGVFAVNLHSEGGTEGLDDKEYFKSVRAALADFYKVEPTEKKGVGDYPELTYVVGDLTITLGAEEQSGFFLRAVHGPLAELAHKVPASGSTKSK